MRKVKPSEIKAKKFSGKRAPKKRKLPPELKAKYDAESEEIGKSIVYLREFLISFQNPRMRSLYLRIFNMTWQEQEQLIKIIDILKVLNPSSRKKWLSDMQQRIMQIAKSNIIH
jgi:hypothetical protein